MIPTFIKGIFMGIAEIIPGVSSSTIALILNIYTKFIDFLHQLQIFASAVIKFLIRQKDIKTLKKDFLKINFKFGIPLGIGMISAVLAFSHIISYTFDEYPTYTFAFFFGLILASIYFPLIQIKKTSFKVFLVSLITLVVFLLILGIKPNDIDNQPSYTYLFFGGSIAICGMVLPGISGSFILLLLGLYDYILEIIKNITSFNVTFDEIRNLIIFSLGIITGFTLFIRLLKYLLKNYNSETMAFLVGLMLASLRVLWPFLDKSTANKPEYMQKVLPWEMSSNIESFILFAIIIITAAITLSVGIYYNSNVQDKKINDD
jgi:putative membrane protein